jgi:superfamily II DNA or RNA helicase
MKLDPRPYQREAMRKAMAYAAQHPYGRLLLVIPTRGGKTLVGAMLVLAMVIRHGLRALWIVHREELLDEAVNHLIEVGINRASIGIIKSGRSTDPDAKVQVASEATLDRRDLPPAHLVVTDECQLDTAPRRRRIRRAYPKAFLLGLTATPKPPPQRDLGEDYDTLMVVVQPSELIHDGYLAVPTVYAPEEDKTPDLRGLRVVGGDYRADDLEPLLARRSLLDEQVREWVRLSEGRASVAFPVTIAHSRALIERFRAVGVNARHLDGNTPDAERREIIQGLKTGRVPIAVSPGVLNEGVNLPRVKCVLSLRPTKSLTLYIQQNMRCATPWDDVRPRILDTVGNCYRHGYPFEDRYWSLVNSESGRPLNGHGAVLKRCLSCGAMMPTAALVCAGCAVPFPVPAPAVPDEPLNLREVEPGADKLEAERKKLTDYATERGFADPPGWAERVLSVKHGVVRDVTLQVVGNARST